MAQQLGIINQITFKINLKLELKFKIVTNFKLVSYNSYNFLSFDPSN
jgi:hypothetical protein